MRRVHSHGIAKPTLTYDERRTSTTQKFPCVTIFFDAQNHWVNILRRGRSRAFPYRRPTAHPRTRTLFPSQFAQTRQISWEKEITYSRNRTQTHSFDSLRKIFGSPRHPAQRP